MRQARRNLAPTEVGTPDGASVSLAKRLVALPFIVLIRLYQATLGPLMGGHCRFHPTCSHYALEAYRTLNPIRATLLTLRRVLRCHPWGGAGYDPPPPPRTSPSRAD